MVAPPPKLDPDESAEMQAEIARKRIPPSPPDLPPPEKGEGLSGYLERMLPELTERDPGEEG